MFDEPVVPKRPARKERPRKQQHHEAAQLDADQEGFEGCPQGLIDLSNDLLESTANPDHRADSFARLGMAMPGTLVSDHMAMPSDSMAMPSDPMAMDVASHDSRTKKVTKQPDLLESPANPDQRANLFALMDMNVGSKGLDVKEAIEQELRDNVTATEEEIKSFITEVTGANDAVEGNTEENGEESDDDDAGGAAAAAGDPPHDPTLPEDADDAAKLTDDEVLQPDEDDVSRKRTLSFNPDTGEFGFFHINWRTPSDVCKHGAWSTKCLVHSHAGGLSCTKQISPKSNRPDEKRECLHKLLEWCNIAINHDDRVAHMKEPPRGLPFKTMHELEQNMPTKESINALRAMHGWHPITKESRGGRSWFGKGQTWVSSQRGGRDSSKSQFQNPKSKIQNFNIWHYAFYACINLEVKSWVGPMGSRGAGQVSASQPATSQLASRWPAAAGVTAHTHIMIYTY